MATYEMPRLTKRNSEGASTYRMGKNGLWAQIESEDFIPMYYQGGDAYYEETNGVVTDYSVFTNADLDMWFSGSYVNTNDDGSLAYMYGTGLEKSPDFDGLKMTAAISRFEKPLSTLSFDGISVVLDTIVASADVQFTCQIIRIEEELVDGYPVYKDTIATAIATISDAYYSSVSGFSAIQFTNFLQIDDLGFTNQIDF